MEPIVMRGGKGKRRMARPESWLCKYPSCKETITVEIQRQTVARKAIVFHLHTCLSTITCSSWPSCSEPRLLCSYNNARIWNCNGALFQFKWKLGSRCSQLKSDTFRVLWTIWLTQYRKWWKNTICKIHTVYVLLFYPSWKIYIQIRLYIKTFLWQIAASTSTIFLQHFFWTNAVISADRTYKNFDLLW